MFRRYSVMDNSMEVFVDRGLGLYVKPWNLGGIPLVVPNGRKWSLVAIAFPEAVSLGQGDTYQHMDDEKYAVPIVELSDEVATWEKVASFYLTKPVPISPERDVYGRKNEADLSELEAMGGVVLALVAASIVLFLYTCLLYTSDAADE